MHDPNMTRVRVFGADQKKRELWEETSDSVKQLGGTMSSGTSPMQVAKTKEFSPDVD